jgi:hypothetical protein
VRTNLTITAYRLTTSRIARTAMIALITFVLLPLGGCASATGTITQIGTQTMEGVRAFSMFAAIALAIYWITYVVLFGLRNVWPEGYNQIQSTWKPAVFLTIATVVGVPALLGWASGIVQSGGFRGGGN